MSSGSSFCARRSRRPRAWAALGASLPWLLAASGWAQWQTQPILVKPGWTAIYLHVDASYQTLDQMVGQDVNNPIDQLWLWQPPPGTGQFVTSPEVPLAGSQWATWGRIGTGIADSLTVLVPNGAYLVHSSATTNFTWNLLGKPVAPLYAWTTSGLNFLGFPTPVNTPPAWDAFLSLAPAFQGTAEIYQYQGGPLSPINPSRVFAYHTTPVTRGEAFWMRSGTVFNEYFGPFQVSFSGAPGVSFGDTVSQYSFHLRNVTGTNVTVNMSLLGSATPPAGQPPISDVPPLLVRGALNLTNLTYAYSTLGLGGSQSWVLQPEGHAGSDIVVVLGLNRYAMTSGAPGATFAGLLEFTDSFGFAQVDAPVSAQVASTTGLWVGSASVSQVANYLKTYQRDPNNNPVVSTNGNYVIANLNTNLGAVASSFPLRLILHNDGTNTYLLQRVFYGLGAGSNVVVATSQTLLDPAHLDTARRISATDLPWSAANAPWAFTGSFLPGGTLTTTVILPYDDQASNPFLHTYHPDHDNLNATFTQELARGAESYDIVRQITLNIAPPSNDFASLTRVGQSFGGTYLETISLNGLGTAARTFNVTGSFSVTRLSPIATLSQP